MSKGNSLPARIFMTALALIAGAVFLLSGNNEVEKPAAFPKFPAIYKNYTERNLKSAQSNGRVAIFFWADWCPTCRSAELDISRNFEKLPKDLTILKADYDTERELKKKYGVTVQHTFVQIDENGNEITKWVGGGVATIIDNLE